MTESTDERYFDREMSWLAFNDRVLSEAMNPSVPLLERLKFLGIVSSNFDEFFMVRVAGLRDTEEWEKRVRAKAYRIMAKQRNYFLTVMAAELEQAGIRRVSAEALTRSQIEYVRSLFSRELLPLLTPMAIRSEAPVPSLTNLGLYGIFTLREARAGVEAKAKQYAVVELPRHFPRIVSLPAEDDYAFILLEDLVSLFSPELFTGYEVLGRGLLRLTRAAELSVNEERDEDFARLMSEALKGQRQNDIVRLEIQASEEATSFVRKKLDLAESEVCPVAGWLDLKSVSQLASLPGFDDLKQPAWIPEPSASFPEGVDPFEVIKAGDVLIQHPYESFDAVIRLLQRAAEDPQVLAIKQTLYRTGGESAIVAALERAAERGKQVTVLVELKARFDERTNIEWARRLERAGANVLYGVAGLKTHAKAILVIRRENEGLRRYVHLGTGNYNEKTAALYSDIGFFSASDELTRDVSTFFNVITGFSQPVGLTKIDISPYGIRPRLKRLIMREAMRSKKDEPGLIMAKMNALVDPEIIEALYRASQAGVQIKLNIRGTCALRPGVKGLSENIEVTGIIDMFLEHSRIFYFRNGGDEEIYLSSADWMPRNLDRRLEIMFGIEDKKIKKQLVDALGVYFKDNTQSWRLRPDGEYEKVVPAAGERKFRAQEYFCRKFTRPEPAVSAPKVPPAELKPQKPHHAPSPGATPAMGVIARSEATKQSQREK